MADFVTQAGAHDTLRPVGGGRWAVGGGRWAVGGAPLQPLRVVTEQYGTLSPFSDGEVNRSGGPRHQGDESGLVALAIDPQRPMSSFEGRVLDVGLAGFAHPQAVQPEEHGERGVGVVESLGAEEESSELASAQLAPLTGVHGGPAQILGRVGRDPSVDMHEAVEPAGRGQAPADRGGRHTTLLHR